MAETRAERLQKLLQHQHLGDQKPSQLLRRMKAELGSDDSTDDGILRQLFLSRLSIVMDLRVLESVQCRWTKRVSGMSGLDYRTRLQLLNQYSVQGRLLRGDMIQFWKMFHSKCSIVPPTCLPWHLSLELEVTGLTHAQV